MVYFDLLNRLSSAHEHTHSHSPHVYKNTKETTQIMLTRFSNSYKWSTWYWAISTYYKRIVGRVFSLWHTQFKSLVLYHVVHSNKLLQITFNQIEKKNIFFFSLSVLRLVVFALKNFKGPHYLDRVRSVNGNTHIPHVLLESFTQAMAKVLSHRRESTNSHLLSQRPIIVVVYCVREEIERYKNIQSNFLEIQWTKKLQNWIHNLFYLTKIETQ